SIFLFEPTPFHLNLLDTFSSFFTSYSIFIYYLFLGLWTTSKERGVDVKVILDKSQLYSKHSVINELFASGIPVWIDDKPKIAHNKVIIVDNQKVITGSFNLSKTAEKGNAENLLIINEYPELVQQYVKNWETRKS
ncbi:MAG: phospholipase D-like domain-containing protein, partial [Wolbachia sp.]